MTSKQFTLGDKTREFQSPEEWNLLEKPMICAVGKGWAS